MSATLSARKSESNLNGPFFEPEAVSNAFAGLTSWIAALFAGDPARELPPRLVRDAGLAVVPGHAGMAWNNADRRRRLPL